MPAQFHCPQCGSAFPYSPSFVGRKARCKSCDNVFVVTAPPDSSPGTTPVPEAAPLTMPAPPTMLPEAEPVDDIEDERPATGSRVEGPKQGFGSRDEGNRPQAPRKSDRSPRPTGYDDEEVDRPPTPSKSGTRRRPADDEDQDYEEDKRPPRRKPAYFERSSGIGLLLLFSVGALVVFVFFAAIMGFCLWP